MAIEICEVNSIIYKGICYQPLIDLKTKIEYIIIDDKKLYLDKNREVAKKQPKIRSVKTAIESFEDIKKVQNYFIENKKWNFYLLFTLNANTGRRISDLLRAKWKDFYMINGKIRSMWNIDKEQKTGKHKELFINVAIQEAFTIYIQKENINIADVYDEPIFKQLKGTHKGKIISEEGYRKALIKAESVLNYEIRSHSIRRGFGKLTMELHPNDNVAKSVLMELFNHSSEKMTNRYIGETGRLEQQYLNDFGNAYKNYVMDGKEVPIAKNKPVSVYNNAELRDYMLLAFNKIIEYKDETNSVKLMQLYNELLDGLDNIAK